MGWGSGVHVLDDVLTKVFARTTFSDEAKTYLTRDLVESFMDNDCDTFDDSHYTSELWFRKALYLAGWYQDDDGYGGGTCKKHYEPTYKGSCSSCDMESAAE